MTDEAKDALAAVRQLLDWWEGPEGWADVETEDRQYESGYKTAWRERAEELREALDTQLPLPDVEFLPCGCPASEVRDIGHQEGCTEL